jgi:inner membrane protein
MDSVTQFTLGAALGVAVMGRTQPAWKSAIVGGIAGTLPDLDAFIDNGDSIADMVLHRAETHAFIWQAVAAPFIATVFAVADRSIALFFRWWVMTLLVLVTHAGLDAMTVYGTRVFLPLDDTPVGVGSIFIIDPLYTLPLLVGVLVVVFGHDRWRWNITGIVLSTLYLGGTFVAQQIVLERVMNSTAAQGLPRQQILVTPTAFNAVLWRVVLMLPDRYEEGYVSLLDPLQDPGRVIRFDAFPRGRSLDAATRGFTAADRLRQFSKGFYAVSGTRERLIITDLRMGQTPWFVFSFEYARRRGENWVPVTPTNVADRSNAPIAGYLRWIGERMLGNDVPPPR